ncbi:MAG: prepilin-type N-terminal cleavage/methylation domain-containing protein [Magnetococcales bacterium]|nr:PilW family protein [Magnetococcales bacterium]NGZ25479.1 prepilin-type N-terminal cleavage/methylation domain-containing protein [Magnetococcales bacterium]
MPLFRYHPMKNNQSGMSLTELMIAMAIGLFLLSGVVTVLINTKATYKVNEGISVLQQNARYIIDELNKKLRMAGYFGCFKNEGSLGTMVNKLNNAGSDEYDYGNAIEVWNATGTSIGSTYTMTATNPDATTVLTNWQNNSGANLPSMLSGLAIPGNDVFMIRGSDGNDIPMAQNNNAAQFFACASATAGGCPDGSTSYSGLCENDIVVASDCVKAFVFQISNLQTTGGGGGSSCTSGQSTNVVHSKVATMVPGNAEGSWGGNNAEDTIGSEGNIIKITSTAYYVGKGSSGSPSLFRLAANSTPEELVEGVENMQILVGEDTDATADGAANRYVDGNLVSNLDRIVSVRICLLMRTDSNVNSTEISGSHILCGFTSATGITITPVADKRIRHTFSTTIKLRNLGSSL